MKKCVALMALILSLGLLLVLVPFLGMAGSGSSSPSLVPFLQPINVLDKSTLTMQQVTGSSVMTSVQEPVLIRQADCSLTLSAYQADVLTVLLSGGGSVVQTAPDFQDTLHAASGLTTTPDVFPGGCDDSSQGKPGDNGVALGRLANGNELVVLNSMGDMPQITVVQGTEQGGLAGTPISIALAPNDQSYVDLIAAGDFNGDGVEDLAVTVDGADPHLAVLLGNADGTFASPVNFAASAGTYGITVADFNADGHPDIAFDNGGTLRVLLGNGGGSFQPPIDGPAVSGNLAAADFNGDHHEDLVDTNGDVLLGQGDGHFTAVADSGLPPRFNTVGIGIGDLNHDGKLDVVLTHVQSSSDENAELLVFLGNGDGTFSQLEPGYAVAIDTFIHSIAVTDLDGDGNPDLVVGSSGGGLFGPAVDLFLNRPGIGEFLLGQGDGHFVGAPLAYQGAETTVADFNRDGKPDLVAFDQTTQGAVQPLLGDGGGGFTAAAPTALPSTTPDGGVIDFVGASNVVADVNGDGKPDLVLDAQTNGGTGTASPSDYLVLLGNGDGSFQVQSAVGLPYGFTRLAAGDFTGDGKMDLAGLGTTLGTTSSSASTLFVLPGNGDGSFASPVPVDTTLNIQFTSGALASGDLNGDGHPDLVAADDSSVKLYLNNGDGTFKAPSVLASGGQPDGLLITDLNGDGRPDLALTIQQGGVGNNDTLMVFLQAADGTLEAPVSTQLQDIFLSSLASADLNGDGKADLLAGGCCGRVFTEFLQGNDDGSFTVAEPKVPLSGSVSGIAVADFNGDGVPDAVMERAPYAAVFLGGKLGAAGSLAIATTSLPAGTVGVAYNEALSAAGGQTPYTWALVSGRLPDGLTLDTASGVISGTPRSAGNFSFTVQVTDGTGATASQTLEIDYTAKPIAMAIPALGPSSLGLLALLLATAGGMFLVWRKRWAERSRREP